MTYKAAIVQSGQNNIIVNKPFEELGKGEMRLRVHGCFICGSDLKTISYGNKRVSKDRIMGHEVSATIVEMSSDICDFNLGDRVALGADFPCLNCHYCSVGNFRRCTLHAAIGHEYDGGFAEFIRVPSSFVKEGPIVKVPDGASFTLAALSEPVACCLRGFNPRFFPDELDNICILGAGPIGSIIATLSKIRVPQSTVTFIDPNLKRLKKLESLGIGDNFYRNAESIPNNLKPNLVFVACSIPSAQVDAIKLVLSGGTICVFGGVPDQINEPIIDSNLIHYKELCVYGTTGSDKGDVVKALEMICGNQALFKKLVSFEISLTEIGKAFEVAKRGDELKVFVRCEN